MQNVLDTGAQPVPEHLLTPLRPGAARQAETTRLPRVVIIGAGFGGLQAARALRKARLHVTVIDRTDHHLFQPLLYQVATVVLSPADISGPRFAAS